MSISKPTLDDTRWCVTGGGSEGTNQAAPASGLKDTGWPTNAVITSPNLNALFRKHHSWAQFLDEVFKVGGAALGDITIGSTITAGSHITTGGLFKHPSQTISVPIAAPVTSTGLNGDDFQFTAGTNGLTVNVPLPVGKRILAFRCRIKDSATGPTTVRGRLYSSTDGTPSAALGTTNTSAGSGATQTLTASSLTITIASLTTYRIVVDAVAGTQPCHVYSIEIDYDQP